MPETSFKNILTNNYNLAPSQLMILGIPNHKVLPVRDFLDRSLKFSDNGNEVGSINYISNSTHFFIRTKALQKEYFLPIFSKKTAVPIRPQVFSDFNLKENDILISKDSNIGEVVILDKDYPNHTISGALYRLPITKNKYYLLSFLKHRYFRDQLDLLVPKGSTIRHAKTLFLDCKIPLPNQKNSNEVINYVELLMESIINKEKKIRDKNSLIFNIIENELKNNQRGIKFNYKLPQIDTLKKSLRIDSGYYCFEYKQKQFLIKNYKYGSEPIKKWGYDIKRGQNLQVSQIGKSVYSNEPKSGFYTLIRPTSFSEFGTVEKFEYLGNSRKLSTLEPGDIVFSAEGTIGKCILFANPEDNWMTNIHGIVLNKKDHNIKESAFVASFLRFLKYWGVLDYISVGGQGGSLAMKYWKDIIIPDFKKEKRNKISALYYNPINYPSIFNASRFLKKDNEWNNKAGIIELDKSAKKIRRHLDDVLDKIINNQEVKIDFSF